MGLWCCHTHGLQRANANWMLFYVPQGVNADWLIPLPRHLYRNKKIKQTYRDIIPFPTTPQVKTVK